jgi:AICAR transformylase/IMP cyclohydrolase PurH (only IMP cyclohydrolase domain in Aful)
LRYGENPHQKARTYNLFKPFFSVVKEGKELSYNNILDAWTAWELVNRLDSNSCVVIKHNYPCGAATGDNSLEMAFMSDEVSAYGGILACNRPLKKDDWHILKDRYIEVVIAPDYENELLNAMEKKKNLRVLRGHYDYYNVPDVKIAGNIILEQEWNVKKDLNFKIETGNPPAKILNDLIFGWELVKTLKSNAVAIVKDLHLKSSGAGQPNRVDSVRIALEKAKSLGRIDDDSLLISDGFFPFVDNLELIHEFGIKNVAAPLGSIRDNEILKYASDKGLNFISWVKEHSNIRQCT